MIDSKGYVYSLKMRDIQKELKFFLYDFYDFAVANEIKAGRAGILSEPIRLINCLSIEPNILKNGFLDIGCNVGQFSLVAAAYGYNVYAFDADRTNIDQLNKSASINGFQINSYCGLVGPSTEEDKQFLAAGPCGNIYGIPFDTYLQDSKQSSVSQFCIDDWWVGNNKPKLDIIKMDIEGAEFMALDGMNHILSESAPPVYIEYNYAYTVYNGRTFADFKNYFAEYGYSPYLIKRKDVLYEITENDFYSCHESGDYLFIHKNSSILKSKLIIPYPVRHIKDFADYAIQCTEARFQIGFAIELLNNIESLYGTTLLVQFYNALSLKKHEMSKMPLTDQEDALINNILARIKEKIHGNLLG